MAADNSLTITMNMLPHKGPLSTGGSFFLIRSIPLIGLTFLRRLLPAGLAGGFERIPQYDLQKYRSARREAESLPPSKVS
jgi:hypothetical protein